MGAAFFLAIAVMASLSRTQGEDLLFRPPQGPASMERICSPGGNFPQFAIFGP